jgi:hypothetical protein
MEFFHRFAQHGEPGQTIPYIGYVTGMATELGFNSRWVASRPAIGITQPPIQWVGLMDGFSVAERPFKS